MCWKTSLIATALLYIAGIGSSSAQLPLDLIFRGIGEIERQVDRSGQSPLRPRDDISAFERGLPTAGKAAVQADLNRLGFDAGSPDGVLGPGARRAIAEFQRSRGFPPTGFLQRPEAAQLRKAAETAGSSPRLAANTAGTNPPSRAIEAPQAAVNASAYLFFADWERIASGDPAGLRQLGLRVFRKRPDLLDRDEQAFAWAKVEDARSGARPTFAERYAAATEFDRPGLLAELRAGIRSEIEALPAEATLPPVRLAIPKDVTLETFKPGRGFPLDTGGGLLASDGSGFGGRILPLHGTASAAFATPLPLDTLPVDEAEGRRILASLASSKSGRGLRRGILYAYVTIRGIDEVAERDASSPMPEVAVKLASSVEALVLYPPAPAGQKSNLPGPPLYRWNLGGAPAQASGSRGRDVLALGSSLGIPVVQGRLATTGSAASELHPVFGRTDERLHERGWSRLLDLVVLDRAPAVADSDEIALFLKAQFVDRRVRAGSYGDYPDAYRVGGNAVGRDEFAVRATAGEFRRSGLATVREMAPSLPIPVVDIRVVKFERYDFTKQSLPITTGSGAAIMLPGSRIGEVSKSVDLTAYPSTLALAPAQAERLIAGQQRAGYDRTAFLAVFADIASATAAEAQPSSSGGRPRIVLDTKVTRIALYADPGLTQEIAAFDLAPLRPRQIETRVSEGTQALSRIAIADFRRLTTVALRKAADPTLTADLGRSSGQYRSANEFARDEILDRFGRSMVGADSGASFWLGGKAKLGAYDRTSRSFPIESYRFGPVPTADRSVILPESDAVKVEVANASQMRRLPMAEDLARQAIEANTSREFDLRVRVTPVSAARDTATSTPAVRLFVDVEEVLVSGGTGNDQVVYARLPLGRPAVAQPAPGGDRPAASDPAPDRVVLNYDVLNLLVLKHAPESVGTSAWARFMGEHWLHEARGDVPALASGRFFQPDQALPNPIERERLMPAFQQWMKARASRVPDKVRLEWAAGATGLAGASCGMVDHMAQIFGRRLLAGTTLQGQQWSSTHVDADLMRTSDTPVRGPIYLALAGYAPLHNWSCTGSWTDMAKRYALAIGSKDNPAENLIVLDAVAPPRDTRDLFSRWKQVDAKISGLDAVKSVGDVADIRIRLEVEEIGYFATDKNTRRKIEPRIEAVRPGDLVRERAARIAALPKFDVIGLKLGDDTGTAEAAVRQHMPVGRTFDLKRGGLGLAADSRPYTSGRLFARADGMEVVVLLDEPPAGRDRVMALVRQVFAPKGSLPPAALLASLKEKYGEPLILQKMDDQGRAFLAAWAAGETNPAVVSRCFGDKRDDVLTLGWTENGRDNPWLSDASGQGLYFPNRAVFQQYKLVWPPAPTFLDGDSPNADATRCPPLLVVEYNGTGQHDQFGTTMVDSDAYHRALIESRRQVQGGASSSGKVEQSKADVKL